MNTRIKAFTLIELLVVIAIIAILAAILFPVFTQAKIAAKKTQSLSQMKQLSLSVMMYLTDHDDTFLPSTNYDTPISDPNRIWTVPLFPYVKNKGIFVSPDSNIGRYAENWDNRHEQSVGMNDAFAFSTLIGRPAGRICQDGELKFGCSAFYSVANESQIEETSRVGIFATTPDGAPGTNYRGYVFGADNGTTRRPDYTAFTSLDQAVPLASDRDLVAELTGLSASELKPIWAKFGKTGNDQGQTPIVFADGHAKTYSAASIRTGASNIIWRFR